MGNDASSLDDGSPGRSPAPSSPTSSQPQRRGSGNCKTPLELLLRRLHAEAQIPFSPDVQASHMLILRQMWSCFNKGDPFKRRGPEWQAVGFQSPDPCTDFRATGLMGAKVIKRILEKNAFHQHFIADVVMLESCMGDGVFYPLMANCVAVLVGVCKLVGLAEGSTAANLFKLRDLDSILREMVVSSSTSNGTATPRRRESGTSSVARTNSGAASVGASPSDLDRFVSTLRGGGGGTDRSKMHISTLFQDARTFELLLLHVIIQFHNNFMHDCIHAGANYMSAPAVLASTLEGTAAWLCEPMPLYERLKAMQEEQTHYNSDEYFSVFLTDMLRHKQELAAAEEQDEQDEDMDDFFGGTAAAGEAAGGAGADVDEGQEKKGEQEQQHHRQEEEGGEEAKVQQQHQQQDDVHATDHAAVQPPSADQDAGRRDGEAAAAAPQTDGAPLNGGTCENGVVPASLPLPHTLPLRRPKRGFRTNSSGSNSSSSSGGSGGGDVAAGGGGGSDGQWPTSPSLALSSRFHTLSNGLSRKISFMLSNSAGHVSLVGVSPFFRVCRGVLVCVCLSRVCVRAWCVCCVVARASDVRGCLYE
jgi:hypothetical protein